MSLPLAHLLNPAPSPRPSPPRTLAPIQSSEPLQSPPYSAHTAQSHAIQSHGTRSPENHNAQPYGSRQSSYSSTYNAPPAAITSSYEAASALTALATSGSQSHYGSHTHSHSPTSRDHFSPVVTASCPPPFDSSRRHSVYAPLDMSPITDRPPSQPSSATSLDRYHHTSSHSPDQQFPSRLESGSVLPPLGQHARTTPPQGLHGSTTAHPGTPGESMNNNLLGEQHSYQRDPIALQDANHSTQHRHPEHHPQMEATEQIPILSPTAPAANMESPAPEPVVEPVAIPSPPRIKDEPSGTPRENTPAHIAAVKEGSPAGADLDSDTLAAIEAAKNESGFSFRDRSSKTKTSIEETASSSTPAALPTTEAPTSKKRPAPPRNRKGMASTVKKPASKKRKIESESSAAGHNVRRSATPNSHNGTLKTPGFRGGAGKKSASQTPAGSSPVPEFIDDGASEAGSDDSSGEVFCLCRKGDNHTYMIACDGGCEDWFHGKCVDIREEDGDLIDKYICPACHEKSGSVTTWLPMCRRDGCRKPARLKKGSASKYCSDECGLLFMQRLVEKSAGGAGTAGAGAAGSTPSSRRNKRKTNRTDHDGNEGDSDDDDLGPRGGALRPSELKALVLAAPDIASFRALGEGVLSPPATVSPTSGQFPDAAKKTNGSTDLPYTLNPAEQQTIASFEEKKVQLRLRRELLRERERFVGMTREQVLRYTEREGLKPKDVCGYDSRLAWPEETFDKWRKSAKGLAALKLGTLESAKMGEVTSNGVSPPKLENRDAKMEGIEGDIDVEKEVQMCTRKRCERHRLWQKQALSDVRFEESTLADEMRGLEAEEKQVREGAMLRWRKEVGGVGGRKEGWVEVAQPVPEVKTDSVANETGGIMEVDP
ncbi:hypothetical protein FKW77_005206 [Venturia effusa]|uniref:PHD-type domain-containing protein n=1 Tax=Venturia effusa TaxID=50376 RepID=A0A517LDR1_9PEZI|nr:hypothetical protein FKW77_005206 [Venturia effusa]